MIQYVLFSHEMMKEKPRSMYAIQMNKFQTHICKRSSWKLDDVIKNYGQIWDLFLSLGTAIILSPLASELYRV